MIRLVWYVNVFFSLPPTVCLLISRLQMAIMSVVNAEKEGHLESKIAKSRQLEEIREAKRKEAESRRDEKDEKFEQRKQDLKKKRKKGSEKAGAEEGDVIKEKDRKFKVRKKVSFR
jgi:60S ribosomal subunit assembly/export protein LOC1